MRLGLIRRGYSASGGAESYLLRLAGGLRAAGHEVVLVGDRPWPQDGLPEGVRNVSLAADSPLGFARQVKEWREGGAEGCDQILSLERVFSCDWYRAGDGVHAAWLDRRKEFESSWRTAARIFNGKHAEILELEEAIAHDEATKIVCNSELVAAEWEQYYPVDRQRLAVVANGFDAEPRWLETDRAQLRAEIAEELRVDPDLPWLLFTGSGFERKGLPLLLQALHCTDRPVEVLVAGKGRGRKIGTVPSRVHLLGERPDVARLASGADLFCLPSWYDPFSNATLEAAAYGCPVITTTSNGFHEEMDDGLHGAVVPAGDVGALVEALNHWSRVENYSPARELCRANAARLSVARNVEATVALFAG